MSYRDRLYSSYRSNHTTHLYGELSLDSIKKQFPVWENYFGRFLPAGQEAKIVDLGCGTGSLVYWLQEKGYTDAEGVDLSSEQVKEAKRLGIKNIGQSDIKTFLSPKINFYDAIFMRDVLEHFGKDEALTILDLIFAALKHNGTLVIQTTNAENPLFGRLRYGDFTHETSFTASSIKQILSLVGFQSVAVYPQRPVVHGPVSLVRAILWMFIELGIGFYLLVATGAGKGIFTENLIAVAEKHG